MVSLEGLNVLPSPQAPSIAPTIRSAASVNNALLQQLALPSPSPAKAPASLTNALQNVLRHGSALTLNSTKRPKGQVKIPYAFPLSASQKARAKLEEKEQRFKNLIVLALVLVTASCVGQYCAAAEADDDAGMYVGAVARAMHKREWDLACQKEVAGKGKRWRGDEVGGRRKRVKLSSSNTATSDDMVEDGAGKTSNNSTGGEKEIEDEEEIPHLVNLEIKNEQLRSDVSLCVHTAQAVMAALVSALEWFEDKYPEDDRSQSNEGNPIAEPEEQDSASQASNPFLESPAAKPKHRDPSPPAQEDESESPLEVLTGLLALFVTASLRPKPPSSSPTSPEPSTPPTPSPSRPLLPSSSSCTTNASE